MRGGWTSGASVVLCISYLQARHCLELITTFVNKFLLCGKIAKFNDKIEGLDGFTPLAVDFLHCCLRKEPTQRKNVIKLLNHPFIVYNTADSISKDFFSNPPLLGYTDISFKKSDIKYTNKSDTKKDASLNDPFPMPVKLKNFKDFEAVNRTDNNSVNKGMLGSGVLGNKHKKFASNTVTPNRVTDKIEDTRKVKSDVSKLRDRYREDNINIMNLLQTEFNMNTGITRNN